MHKDMQHHMQLWGVGETAPARDWRSAKTGKIKSGVHCCSVLGSFAANCMDFPLFPSLSMVPHLSITTLDRIDVRCPSCGRTCCRHVRRAPHTHALWQGLLSHSCMCETRATSPQATQSTRRSPSHCRRRETGLRTAPRLLLRSEARTTEVAVPEIDL